MGCWIEFQLRLDEKLELWYVKFMRIRSVVAHVFAFLAVLGLVLAPLARPAMAMPANMHATMVDPPTAPHDMAAMVGDMPCCPAKPSLPDCERDCPFMAACGVIVLHGTSQSSLIIPLTLLAIVLPGGSSALVSLAHTPPRKPPKA